MDIYVQRGGQKLGPFPETKIRQGIDAGEFAPADLAWTTGKASWQPLSALINLDVTQPPPIPSSLTIQSRALAVSDQPMSVAPLQTPPVPITHHPVARPSQREGRTCKKCGAPYKLWSWSRAMGSGLCESCSPKRDDFDTSDSSPITSREQALKTVKTAGILYLCLGMLDTAVGLFADSDFLFGAVLCFVGGIAIWKAHSRVAAILLLVYLSASILYNVVTWNAQALFGAGPIILIFQIGVTIKATKAVFMLNNEFFNQPSDSAVQTPSDGR